MLKRFALTIICLSVSSPVCAELVIKQLGQNAVVAASEESSPDTSSASTLTANVDHQQSVLNNPYANSYARVGSITSGNAHHAIFTGSEQDAAEDMPGSEDDLLGAKDAKLIEESADTGKGKEALADLIARGRRGKVTPPKTNKALVKQDDTTEHVSY